MTKIYTLLLVSCLLTAPELIKAEGHSTTNPNHGNNLENRTIPLVSNESSSVPPGVLITGNLSFCVGSSTTLDAGAGYVSYLWSDGSTNQTLLVTVGGVYAVTVADVNTTVFNDSVTVVANPNPSPLISGNLSFCPASTTTIDAGGGYSSYFWSSGSSSQTISVNVSGTYTVSVTDANGCSGSTNATVNENPNPNPSISGNLSYCIGFSTTLDAGNGYTSFLWSDGSSNQTLAINTAGAYTVTVTDTNGCSGSQSVNVIENTITTTNLTADGPLVFCEGGGVNISADGGYNSYNWSTGESTQSINITSGGVYTVTVSAANGCTSSTSVTITVNPNPIINPINQINVDCNGNATGSFEVTASGGTGPYGYSLNGDTYQSSGFFNNLTFGIYSVSVIDSATNCSSSTLIDITEPNSITTSSTQVDLLCYDEPTGSIDITVSGGIAPYIFDWSNGSTDEDISSLVAGIYAVTITDANGCIYFNVFEILQPSQITLGAQQTNVSCSYGADGTAFVDVDGGTPGYNYIWDNNQTGPFAFGLNAGLHTVTITDANGCDTSLTFLITVPPQLNSSSVAQNVSCYGACDGSITLSPYGGTPYVVGNAYEVVWNTIPVQTGMTATGLCAGTYTAEITDSTGCVKYHVETITEPDQLVVAITPDNVSCHGANDGEASANVIGGTPVYFYLWSNGQLTQTATGLTAGTYTVTVTDYNGCSLTKSVIITQPNTITVSGVITNIKCNGGVDGKVLLTVTGGAGGFTYLWNTNPAKTTKNLNNVAAGTYTVIVTDNSGCTVSATFTVTQPLILACNGVVNNLSCNSTNNGSIQISPSGGTVPYAVIWSNGNTTNIVSGLMAGSYTVTITDVNNCSTTCVFVVSQSAGFSITGSIQNVNCNGDANGYIVAQPVGGTAPFTYLWNNGTTTQTATGLSGGTYTVTVTDGVGCTQTTSFTLIEPAVLSCICNANIHNVSCYGGSNGSITAQPTGGTPPYSYVWSNGAFTQTISGLTAGTYTVTITDANGCQKIGVVTVSQPTQLFATISCINNATCFGNNNGSACVTGFGGTPPYTYLWNTIPVQTTFSATGLGAGTYTATVTDANGCTATASVTILQPSSSLSCTINKTDVVCHGQSNGTATVNPTGGTLPYTYLWNTSPIKTTKTVLGLSAGNYTVIVTDAVGCSSNCTITINQPPTLLALASVTNVTCNGGNNGAIDITVTGGTPGYSYNWSNGATTQDLTGLSAGNYQVTIADSKGCIAILNITIIQPSQLSCSTLSTNVNCNGGNNGTGSVVATGGVAPYSYLWSNGGINSHETGLLAGTYTVTVTDSKGCTTSCSLTITQPAALSCNVVLIQNETCNGANGQLQVNVTGGTPPYSYSWTTTPVQTTSVATGLTPGSYSVLVTDSKGCSTICSGSVGGSAAITCNITGTNVTCNGGSNGTATVNPSGGTSPYTYLWNTLTAETTASVSGLTAGTYAATVTDANGCTSVCSIIIAEPIAIVISISSSNVSCNSGNNGSATATVTGGTSPYGYLWSTAETTQSISGLIAGTYTVTVTDFNGCTKTKSVTITQPTTISCSTTSTDVSCFGGNNGTATVNTSGGTGTLTISWNTIPGQSTATATGLTAGIYTVTITDANGCTSSCTAQIAQPSSSVSCSTSVINNVTCFGGNNGSASVTPAGGTAPYIYSWNTIPVQTNSTATGLTAGTFTATVTDATGCTSACTVTISQPSQLTCIVTPIHTSCGLDNGQVSVTPNGGSPSYLFLWSNGSTEQSLTALPPGDYTVTVTDANGCTSSCEASVNSSSQVIFTTAHTNLSCNGICNGTATVDAIAGGVSPYSYLWSNGSTNVTATGLCAQTYTVTVIDNVGCSATATVVITEPTTLVLSFTNVVNVGCNGGSNGQAKVNPTGGTPAYTYLWSNGQTNQTATGLSAGSYTVTVTDSHGCTAVDSVVINQSGTLTYTQSQTNVSCNGGSNGTSTVNPSGGTPPYTYLWSNGQTTQTATGLSAGHYTVEISDGNGCNNIADFDISQPPVLSCVISQSNPSCNGSSNGFATVVPSGGTPSFTFLWSDGQTTQTATGLIAGTYTSTVTDTNGCTSSCSVLLTNPLVVSCSVNTNPVSCVGGANGTATVTPSGGTPPYTYLWSNGQTTVTATGLVTGTYTVTVSDQYGCSSACSGNVTELPPITITFINVVNSTCDLNNGSAEAVASGGTPPYNYVWSNSQVGSILNNVGGGTYTVTVTDANGCTGIDSVIITGTTALDIILSGTNPSCFGGSDGTATVVVTGGSGVYTYSWNSVPVQTTSTATGLMAGTYCVLVTDQDGCTAYDSVTLVNPPLLLCSVTPTDATCGINNGTVTVTPTGGTLPYSYLWSNGSTDASVSDLAGGTYTVTVTDSHNCTTSCSATINTSNTPTCLITGASSTCTGAVQWCASPGMSSYIWSTGETTECISVSAAGTYTVTISDANGCTSSCEKTLTGGIGPSCLISGNGTICSGSSTQWCAPSGLSSYLWSTGASTQCINVSIAGTYTVTISDVNGCTSSCEKTLNEFTPPSCSITGNSSICSGSSTQYCATSGLSSYLWNTGATTQCITVSAAGTYTVTVTDANGCTSSCSKTLVVNQSPICLITGSGIACSGSSIQWCAPPGLASYLWSTGATTQCITLSTAGTYTLTVTDANGCTSSCNKALTVSGLPGCTITGVASICAGTSVQWCAPAGPASYLWSTGATTQCITVSIAGTYTITTTNANGCTKICSKTLTLKIAPVCNITKTGSLCATGSVQLCATAGMTGYLWSTGATTQCVTVNASGVYTVTVTKSNGCTSSCFITVNGGSPITAVVISKTNVSCNGGSNGTACISSVTGGTTPYSYLWTNGASTICITNLSIGVYTVTVTDANGCTKTKSTTITQPSLLSCSVAITKIPTCGLCDGKAKVTATGGSTPYTYSWNTLPVKTTQTATGLCAATYNVIVTDAKGCTTMCSVTLAGGSSPSCLITGNGSICSGSSTQWCAPAGLASYLWSTGATTQCIVVSSAGTYTVTTTNVSGCSSICNKTLIVNAPPSCVISGSSSICSGPTQWCAPAGLSSYLWSTGATTQCVSVSVSGTYTVTVTDANGCTSSCNKTLTAGVPPTCSITGNGSICSGSSAQWCAPAGLTSYLWSTGATTQCITVSVAGTYSVTVTDAAGCSSNCSKELTVNAPPSCLITGNGSVCSGSSAQWCAPSGMSSYLWSTGATTQCITVSIAATYTVTVTDANGCTSSCNKTLAVNASPSCLITGNGSVCSGSSAQWCAPSGLSSYIWSTGATTQCITVSSAGTYTVTVTDANGCTSSCTKALSINPPPTCLITGSSSICSGSTQWCAPAGLSSYLWSTGATTQCITVNTAGTYTVTVTDANGCSSSCNKTLVTGTPPSCLITGNSVICSGGSTQWCAPAGLSSYLWSTGATTQCIAVSIAGTYTVTVTEAGGCSSICTKTLITDAAPVCSISGKSSICQGEPNQWCAPSGLSSYLWSTGATTQCISANIAGTYTVTVTNASGCTSSCTKSLVVNPLPSCTISWTSAICQGNSGQICAPAGAVSYLWSTGATTQCITISTTNDYTVTVTNASGCTNSCTVKIIIQPLPVCSITGNNTVCNGCSTPWCAPPGMYSYVWSNGATTQCINVSTAGTYTVTIMNNNGCTSTCSKTLSVARLGGSGQTINIESAAYPNPFSSITTIEFMRSDKAAHMTVEIYSLTGNKVATIFDGEIDPDIKYQAKFNAENMADGIYFYRLTSGEFMINEKLTLIRQ